MITHGHELSDGVKMALLVSATLTAYNTLHLPSGTKRSGPPLVLSVVALLTQLSNFLKERLFGLSNPQGNHGESIKEAHFHLDNVPTVCPCSRLRVRLS